MAKKPNWDYALRIKGVSLETLPIAVLAEYLKEFASLMGDSAKPVLDGIVKGSVIVRVRQAGEHPAYTRNRLQQAANDPLGPGGRSYERITQLMPIERVRSHPARRSSALSPYVCQLSKGICEIRPSGLDRPAFLQTAAVHLSSYLPAVSELKGA